MRLAIVVIIAGCVTAGSTLSSAQENQPQENQPVTWTTRIAAANPVTPTVQPVVIPAAVSQPTMLAPPAMLPIAAPPTSATELVRQHLLQIDQQLSAMLAHPPNLWDPMAVAPQLQSLAVTAPTAELREYAQQLLAKAVRSQQVQQGYAQVAASFQASVQPASAQVAARYPVQQAVAQTNSAAYYTAPPSPYAQGPLHVSPEFRPFTPTNILSRVRQAAFSVGDAVQPGGATTTYGRLENGVAPTPAACEPQIIASPVDENGYSGTGWLMPLVARSQMSLESRAGVPPLALTDDDGNVKFLVTPSSGMSLREYLRKEVGIIGPVGTLPEIATPHITAQRAVVLERHE